MISVLLALQVRATDGAGNVQSGSLNGTTTVVDTTPPVVILTQRPDLYTNSLLATMCVRVEDATATLASVRVTVGGVAFKISSATGCGMASMGEGNYSVVANADDPAGA